MPNWCSNELRVKGTKRQIDGFIKKMVGKNHDGMDETLSFNKVVPMPKKIREADGDGWYNWCLSRWGTKWDARDAAVNRVSATEVGYTFDTAWSPPEAWFAALSDKYPKLLMELRYWEGGMGFAGYFTAEDGDVTNTELDYVESQIDWFGVYEACCDHCSDGVQFDATPIPKTVYCEKCLDNVCSRCQHDKEEHAEGKCLFEATTFKPLREQIDGEAEAGRGEGPRRIGGVEDEGTCGDELGGDEGVR